MAKPGKKTVDALRRYDREQLFAPTEAIDLVKAMANRKFDETVEVAIKLGVDPKQSDQLVRGATVLPHGIGKAIRVVAIVRGEAEKEARDAGADFVGNDDLIEKIAGGWLEFDRILTTPDTLKDLTKVAKVLGPKGLMPNKKTGTVTSEIGKAVKEQKLGKVEYKVEKAGIVHAAVGKKSFGVPKLKENFLALFDNVLKAKPPTSKGIYIRKVALSATMSPGIVLDHSGIELIARAAL